MIHHRDASPENGSSATDEAPERRGSPTLDQEVLPSGGRPTVEVKNDYDNYFENYVLFLIDEKEKSGCEFKTKKVVIDAGPWRSYNVRYNRIADTLFLDFYSACRYREGPDANEEIIAQL